MNIGEFVDSIKIQLSDLEKVGEAGYIEGISSIIVKNLKQLDVTKRPVHCTDKKRETVYIKDDDKWEKDEDKSKMHKLIKKVVLKNSKMFPKFREAHPDCTAYYSKFSDQYNKIIYESMGGKGDDDFEKNEKIIKNVLEMYQKSIKKVLKKNDDDELSFLESTKEVDVENQLRFDILKDVYLTKKKEADDKRAALLKERAEARQKSLDDQKAKIDAILNKKKENK
jgi:Txe/YoeB family toxin of Txe-Axe toxin-antitoxin module